MVNTETEKCDGCGMTRADFRQINEVWNDNFRLGEFLLCPSCRLCASCEKPLSGEENEDWYQLEHPQSPTFVCDECRMKMTVCIDCGVLLEDDIFNGEPKGEPKGEDDPAEPRCEECQAVKEVSYNL